MGAACESYTCDIHCRLIKDSLMSNTSFTVSSLSNSGLSSSLCYPTPLGTMSPQGKFVQRLCQVENENKLLKQELSQLKKWKTSVQNWLIDSFGFVADGKDDDDEVSVSSHESRDTNSRPADEVKSDHNNATYAVVHVKTEVETDDNSVKGNTTGFLDTTQPLLRNSTETSEGIIAMADDAISTNSTDEDETSSSRDTVIVQEFSTSSTATNQIDDPEVYIVNVDMNGTEGSKLLPNGEARTKQSHDVNQTVGKKTNSTGVSQDDTLRKQAFSPQKTVRSLPPQQTPTFSPSHTYLVRERVNESPAIGNSNVVSTIEEVAAEIETMDPTPCDICRHHLPESQNNMIYCETCNVCVHQACYGVRQIPDEEWNCQPCVAKIPIAEQKCRFCTVRGGAMVRVKSPNHATWAHVSCTWWIPGVHINNPSTMDMVVGMPNVEKRRWNLHCYICKAGRGSTCCVQCVYKKCAVSFHVTCAFKMGLRMDMVDDNEAPDGILLYSFCPAHRQKGPEQAVQRRNKSGSPDKKKRKIEEVRKS